MKKFLFLLICMTLFIFGCGSKGIEKAEIVNEKEPGLERNYIADSKIKHYVPSDKKSEFFECNLTGSKVPEVVAVIHDDLDYYQVIISQYDETLKEWNVIYDKSSSPDMYYGVKGLGVLKNKNNNKERLVLGGTISGSGNYSYAEVYSLDKENTEPDIEYIEPKHAPGGVPSVDTKTNTIVFKDNSIIEKHIWNGESFKVVYNKTSGSKVESLLNDDKIRYTIKYSIYDYGLKADYDNKAVLPIKIGEKVKFERENIGLELDKIFASDGIKAVKDNDYTYVVITKPGEQEITLAPPAGDWFTIYFDAK